jgi:spermidine/putrescine transport system permease protein
VTFGRLRALVPYILLAPGIAWLLIFFVAPMVTLAQSSLEEGAFDTGFRFTWHLQNFTDSIDRYQEQFIRSFRYAGIATLLAFVIGYPLAYFIAWRAGRFKNYFLFLVVLPFFTTYLIRTLAWQTILSDEGDVVSAMRGSGVMDVLDTLHISQNGRLLATPTAVVTAITYNLLPFMVLPIYVSLERINRGLVEAAHDLYGGPIRAFLRVVFPLSLPGVFAGTLLTFIPAAGDFVNAALLGSPNTTMIGNVIQSRFLVLLDYPSAAALSFVLMAAILVAVSVYARLLGTEEIT